jgi:hypothetical protein
MKPNHLSNPIYHLIYKNTTFNYLVIKQKSKEQRVQNIYNAGMGIVRKVEKP